MHRIRDLVAVIITGLAAAFLSGYFGADSVPAERRAVPMPAEILLPAEDVEPMPQTALSISLATESDSEGGPEDVTPPEPSNTGAALETADSLQPPNDLEEKQTKREGGQRGLSDPADDVSAASPGDSETLLSAGEKEAANTEVSSIEEIPTSEDHADPPPVNSVARKPPSPTDGVVLEDRADQPWRVDLRSNVHLTVNLGDLTADDVMGLADFVVLFLDDATFRLEPHAASTVRIGPNRLCMPLREKRRPGWVQAHLSDIMVDRSHQPSDVRLILNRRWQHEFYRRVFESIGDDEDFAATDYAVEAGFRQSALGFEFVVNTVRRRPFEPRSNEGTMKDER